MGPSRKALSLLHLEQSFYCSPVPMQHAIVSSARMLPSIHIPCLWSTTAETTTVFSPHLNSQPPPSLTGRRSTLLPPPLGTLPPLPFLSLTQLSLSPRVPLPPSRARRTPCPALDLAARAPAPRRPACSDRADPTQPRHRPCPSLHPTRPVPCAQPPGDLRPAPRTDRSPRDRVRFSLRYGA
jgi:hypothetical protein